MAYGDNIFEHHGQNSLEMNREGVDIAGFAGSRFWLVDLIPPTAVHPVLVSRCYISADRPKVEGGV